MKPTAEEYCLNDFNYFIAISKHVDFIKFSHTLTFHYYIYIHARHLINDSGIYNHEKHLFMSYGYSELSREITVSNYKKKHNTITVICETYLSTWPWSRLYNFVIVYLAVSKNWGKPALCFFRPNLSDKQRITNFHDGLITTTWRICSKKFYV